MIHSHYLLQKLAKTTQILAQFFFLGAAIIQSHDQGGGIFPHYLGTGVAVVVFVKISNKNFSVIWVRKSEMAPWPANF